MLKTFESCLENQASWVCDTLQVMAASIALALFAQVAIWLPFTPVPITLQSMAIFLLALTMGPKKSSLAVIAYLAQGSLGLPVFAGGLVNPLWFLGPRVGYFLGFVVAAWLIGYLAQIKKERTLIETFLILFLGEAVLLTLGSIGLSFFVGLPNAIGMGVLPFLVGDAVKITLAALSLKPLNRWLSPLF